jgi:crotonobetainyl-CoA:carnitine CoA-transferase CaiB-like acyl-CoA transferase
VAQAYASTGSFLSGIRVLEMADELGEYCGKVLAGLGADVIKVEPPGGERTRRYGPFFKDDPHPDRSLYFWHYNFGKRGITLDLSAEEGRTHFRQLARTADVIIDTRHRSYLSDLNLGYAALSERNAGLIYARISPFGDDGPWADYVASDLVHLALGGVMMNCGYDPTPQGEYDTPPVAPQMWQSYQIAGEQTAIAIIAALVYRLESGRGQRLSTSVHEAVSKNTETDLPDWIFSRRPHARLTCRHSFAQLTDVAIPPATSRRITVTKDGRWILPYRTYLQGSPGAASTGDMIALLRKHGIEDIGDEKYDDPAYLQQPEVVRHVDNLVDRMILSYVYDRDLWKEAQAAGFAWGPIRRPEENAADPHWAQRETFTDVEYPEVNATFRQVHAKWLAPGLPWRTGPRAPLTGEHTTEVLAELARCDLRPPAPKAVPAVRGGTGPVISKRGAPFALSGVRVIDLAWILASAGGSRFFTALGAEVIKVEHSRKLDMGRAPRIGLAPDGGRPERDRATAPIMPSPTKSFNRSGNFMDINAGKRALSLNLATPRGKEILTELLRDADVLIEGFSPGTMIRMGFGWDELRKINPRLVYVQQSGFGQHGEYGRFRSYGPTAQAVSGISDMSGLPEPYPPAGIGYSYLDWFGAYQMALGMMAGLYRQRMTGEGCWIDSAQIEVGIYLTGTSILDRSANGRRWSRYGNRSPYKLAAPSGAYRAAGSDRWVAISCFTDEQWLALARVLGRPEWPNDERLATLDLRARHQDELDALITAATAARDPFALMSALQTAGVPAGVCQTPEDRYEWDPQLKHLEWLVDLEQTEIGRWPAKELSVRFSETPPYIGGIVNRHGPNYGEDNDYVLRDILKMSTDDIAELGRNGVI